MAGGIRWFMGPAEYEQRFSVAADELEGKAEEVVREVVEHAEKRMQQIIRDGGINKTKKGGARMLTTDMYSSVGSKSSINTRSRVQGEFGFIDNAPFYTRFQEDGTRARANNAGIAPMLAFATALAEADDFFQDKIEATGWLPGVR